MLISFLALAASTAAPAAPHLSPSEARALGYAQAQQALAQQDGSTPNMLAPNMAPGPVGGQAPLMHPASALPVGSSASLGGLQFQAVPDAGANIRYYKGVATIDRADSSAAVQLAPVGLDHGRLTFAVSVLNLSGSPDNFGIENVTARAGDGPVAVLSRERLDHMATNRAHWRQFGMAMVGGLAAASAASTNDVYQATAYTPYGAYRTTLITPSIGGQIAAAEATAATGYALAGIQARLDATREALADEILQTTTVMPQNSYAARFVVDKIKGGWPQKVQLVMTFAGKQYPFDFVVSKER